MSEENVQTVRAVFERWGKGDFSAAVDLFDPHVVMVVPPVFGPEVPDARAYLGVEGVATYTRRYMLEPWENVTVEAEEIVAAGDSVVVGLCQRAVGRTSGVPTEARYFMVWSFRGPKVIHLESFLERAEALEAVGLSE